MRPSIEDEHVQPLALDDDTPDLVVIQVYITNAYRAYRLADRYRALGSFVALGGLHVTSLPHEAAPHADAIFLGPGEQTFPQFLEDFRAGHPLPRYESTSGRTLDRLPAGAARPHQAAQLSRPELASSSRAAVRSTATSATRTPSLPAAARSTRSAWTTRSPRLRGCQDAISTSSTIISSATAASGERSSTACAA